VDDTEAKGLPAAPGGDAVEAGSGPGAGGIGGWDHPAYLLLAWSELRERRFGEAVARVRAAIAPAHAHATLTLAWARLVDAAISCGGAGADLAAFLALHPRLADPALIHQHYSPERLASPHARRVYVLPDRAPLPSGSDRSERPDPSDPAGASGASGDEGTKSVSSP
jgi:hypothetical protein